MRPCPGPRKISLAIIQKPKYSHRALGLTHRQKKYIEPHRAQTRGLCPSRSGGEWGEDISELFFMGMMPEF